MLTEKVINIIKKAEKINKFTSMPQYQNQVSCQNYDLGNVLLKIPNNGCKSFAVIVDGVEVGRVESDIIYTVLNERMNQIKKELIDSL